MYSSQLQSWLLLFQFLSKDNKGLELSTKPGTRINKNFHFLKITVSQLLEMIDGCHLSIFFYYYYLSYLFVYKYILYLLKNNFIFYFYFYLIFTLLLYFWYCNLFNLYWVDAKALSVNKCRCRCNKVTPGFEPFTGKRNAINTEVEIDERKATDKLSHTIFFFSKKDLKKKRWQKNEHLYY